MAATKKWSKPKLVVLARSSPEEMVLLTCKGNGSKQPHQTGQTYCLYDPRRGTCDGNRLS